MKVRSPLIGSDNVTFIKSIKVDQILRIYQKILPEIDPAYLFHDLTDILLYECNETKYRFYWPLNISGDDQYYAKLGESQWYYLPWKWEHNESLKYINEGDKVLEVGAAKGDFLKRIKHEKSAEVVGLELNSKAGEYSEQSGVEIIDQTVQNHAIEYSESYDVVCTFQVLEHISEVEDFISAMVKCLKKGGRLIISVPNNAGFVGRNRMNSRVLNMPPHHMGLWTESSLRELEKYFDISYLDKDIEPLQEHHYETYLMNRFYDWFKFDLLVKIMWKLGITRLFKSWVLRNKSQVIGHSINVYYTKT